MGQQLRQLRGVPGTAAAARLLEGVGAKVDVACNGREAVEKLFGGKVHLEVWVKVKSGWTEDQRLLHELGYA